MSSSLMPMVDKSPVKDGTTTATGELQHDHAAAPSSERKGPMNTSKTTSNTTAVLDFIGSAGAVKDLFALPYAVDRPISVAVHNMGGTLLLDPDPGLQNEPPPSRIRGGNNRMFSSSNGSKKRGRRPLPRKEEDDDGTEENGNSVAKDRIIVEPNQQGEGEPEKSTDMSQSLVALSSLEDSVTSSEALTIVNTLIQSHHSQPSLTDAATTTTDLNIPADEYAAQFIPPSPEPREYLSWKFHDMNLLVGSDALIYRSPNNNQNSASSPDDDNEGTTALTVRVEDAGRMQNMLQQHENTVRAGAFVPDHRHAKLKQLGKPSYAEAAAQRQQNSSTLLKDREESSAEAAADEDGTKEKASASNKQATTSGTGFAAPNLDQVELQSCIVPYASEPSSVGSLLSSATNNAVARRDGNDNIKPMSPISTVLDTYLDNIMANVPQLALCLQEKGFIQSVKLLNTEAIPSQFMQRATFDTSTPLETISGGPGEDIFSPEVMEMNASTLLRFLKTNCSRDNATYLFRREAGHTNIQLYDISSISAERQQKWTWWLAMISYRFSNRLRHLSLQITDKALRRNFRERQRSLLQNTIDLLETLADMNGNAHESLAAAVRENLADTFLVDGGDEEEKEGERGGGLQSTNTAAPIVPPPQAISSHQPYANSSADALGKAQDHLTNGIKILKVVLEEHRFKQNEELSKAVDASVETCESESEDDDGGPISIDDIDPVVTQLFGLNHKLIGVALRLAEIHIKNYYSSSAMHNLRTAAKVIAKSLEYMQLIGEGADPNGWLPKLQLQYTWLWEQCGYFARSFAADSLWRERGHASGDDVVSVLLDVEAALAESTELDVDGPLQLHIFTQPADSLLSEDSNGMLSLQSLSGIVDFRLSNSKGNRDRAGSREAGIQLAERRLSKQKTLRRDERKVLVAASIAYSRATKVFGEYLLHREASSFHQSLVDVLQQRLGDACNETGKVMLNELRSWLMSLPSQTEVEDEAVVSGADVLCSSAEFWFLEGLHAFEACRDLRNTALLRCNLCQIYKLRANAIFAAAKCELKKVDEASHADICLREATNQLQAAHEALNVRDFDPNTWDMVSTELAATFLVLGVRRRQALIGSGNNVMVLHALRLSPGKERSIVDPMTRALDIYDQMGNLHQAAATHYQLALFYCKIWTCQRDEGKTREKLAAAFNHYNRAFAYFSQAVKGNEATFCLLCLDIASLYSAVSGQECLEKALLRCLDAAESFNAELILMASKDLRKRGEWFQKMDTLASSVEERVFKLLKSLVKLEEEGSGGTKYKDLYRAGLTAKISSGTAAFTTPLGDGSIDAIAGRLTGLLKILRAVSDLHRASSGAKPN